MTEPSPCPCGLTYGQLAAAAAICSNSKAAGGPKLAAALRAHAQLHPPATTPQETA